MLQVNNGVHFVEEEPILLQNAVRLCNQATDRNSAQRCCFLFFLRLMEMLPSSIFFFFLTQLIVIYLWLLLNNQRPSTGCDDSSKFSVL